MGTATALAEQLLAERARAERFRSLAAELAEALERAGDPFSFGTREQTRAALSKAKGAGLLGTDG